MLIYLAWQQHNKEFSSSWHDHCGRDFDKLLQPFFRLIFLNSQKNECKCTLAVVVWLVMGRVSPGLSPPARSKQILPYPSPPEARNSKKVVGSNRLNTCKYINTYPLSRPKQILPYPIPPEVQNPKKNQKVRARPKPKKLRLAHHYVWPIRNLWKKKVGSTRQQQKAKSCFFYGTWS